MDLDRPGAGRCANLSDADVAHECSRSGVCDSDRVAQVEGRFVQAAADDRAPDWQGGKLSDALADANVLPAMAVRMLKLGEETGQLPTLAGRIAEFYEAKLQRSLDRIVGIAGPAAIITISIVVGGLIVSVMTSLLSVSQIVG